MDKLIFCLFVSVLPVIGFAELTALSDEDLSGTTGASGIEVDIDISNVELTYSYQNNENPNENFWVVGADPGGDLGRINGITLDVISTDDGSALAIGMPETIELSNYNTGDYYIAHPNTAPNTAAPFIDTDPSDGATNEGIAVSEQRKLIGLRWNAPIGLTTGNSAIDNFDYSSELIRMTGHVLVFGAQ
jgi:hypothetical protein